MSESYITKEFMKLMKGSNAQIKNISELSQGEYGILQILLQGECDGKKTMTSGELCHAQNLTSGRISTTLKTLEMKKYIIRENDALDKRRTLVKLTEKGKDLAIKIKNKIVENVKILKHKDIVEISDDHNPGMANAFKYGGKLCGILALIFDFFKGVLPVYIATRYLDTTNALFALVIISPLLGHAFPIFNGFKKGGKCILTSFGVLFAILPNFIPFVTLALSYIFFSTIIIVNPHALRSIIAYGCWFIAMIVMSIFQKMGLSIVLSSFLIAGLVCFKHLKSLKESESKEIRFAFGKN